MQVKVNNLLKVGWSFEIYHIAFCFYLLMKVSFQNLKNLV